MQLTDIDDLVCSVCVDDSMGGMRSAGFVRPWRPVFVQDVYAQHIQYDTPLACRIARGLLLCTA